MKTQFYTFSQNNSGGSFSYSKESGVTRYVIIEAVDVDDAVNRAENIGLYFNGVEDGSDCPCCGDRWSRPWSDESTDEPLLYGHHPSEHQAKGASYRFFKADEFEVAVHCLDGRIYWYH